MSKKKKELTHQKNNEKGKKDSKKSGKSSGTWVEMAYQLSVIVRVGNNVIKGYHPATYFKMAKDNIGIPVLQKHSNETIQLLGYLTTEVVECVISPPVYGINKVASLLSSGVGFFVKQSFDIQHPELKAAVDVVCNEAAHQSAQSLITMRGFFKTMKTEQIKQQAGPQILFRSKL